MGKLGTGFEACFPECAESIESRVEADLSRAQDFKAGFGCSRGQNYRNLFSSTLSSVSMTAEPVAMRKACCTLVRLA